MSSFAFASRSVISARNLRAIAGMGMYRIGARSNDAGFRARIGPYVTGAMVWQIRVVGRRMTGR